MMPYQPPSDLWLVCGQGEGGGVVISGWGKLCQFWPVFERRVPPPRARPAGSTTEPTSVFFSQHSIVLQCQLFESVLHYLLLFASVHAGVILNNCSLARGVYRGIAPGGGGHLQGHSIAARFQNMSRNPNLKVLKRPVMFAQPPPPLAGLGWAWKGSGWYPPMLKHFYNYSSGFGST